ncbi:MAG: methyltransferase domain-containing protein [Chthoniobacterales bacterium]|nr:methyltransferase domain-containing protein [Chthoniobacterales bacterium]
MADQGTSFSASVPEKYDRYLGPMLFEPYARDLSARLKVRAGLHVLEVACGTGIVTRSLRERVPADGKLVATDLSEPMLAFARTKFTASDAVEWQQADAMALPFPDESFDAVVCQFGLMFVPDKLLALREARRVSTDGGQLLFNVWESLERNPLTDVAHTTAASLFPSDPPKFFETPFGCHDVSFLNGLLRETGFKDVTVTPVDLPCVSPSAADAARGLVQGTPLVVGITERNGDIDAVTNAVAQAIRARFGDGPVRSRMRALICEATR